MKASPSERTEKKKKERERDSKIYMLDLGLDLTGELGDAVWELHGP